MHCGKSTIIGKLTVVHISIKQSPIGQLWGQNG